jgi:hypothetical protein
MDLSYVTLQNTVVIIVAAVRIVKLTQLYQATKVDIVSLGLKA